MAVALLTTEDRQAIEDHYARCYWANDTGDADGWLSSFHEGATLVHEQRLIEGKPAIREYIRDRIARRDDQPFKNGHHLITNLLIEAGPDSVRSRCYFAQIAQNRETGAWAIRTAGRYEDELRKLDGVWGFTFRRALHEVPTANSSEEQPQ